MTVVPTNESKEIIEKSEKLWSKIRDLIRSVIINSNENYMKTKFDSVDNKLTNNSVAFGTASSLPCVFVFLNLGKKFFS